MRLSVRGIHTRVVSTLVPTVIARGLESGRKASNLAFALRILPAPRRRDALVFYRFCRTLDDIADSTELPGEERTAALAAWQKALSGESELPSDLADVVDRNQIDRQLLLEILAGVRSDLTVNRYATFEDARQYCWRVASAVGLASIRIFGCTRPESETYAENLGLALQWTNILRDVGEDAANGRIYLPIEDLHRFEVSEDDLFARRDSKKFQRLMSFETGRAREFFTKALHSLTPADRTALIPAEIMRAIYERLLTRMEADHFQVFRHRYRVSRIEKLWLASKVFFVHSLAGWKPVKSTPGS
jgi:phytoene synthase